MEKCASQGSGAHCTRVHVITLMCFDSSESLNIKLYWIRNENSWGTGLDQHFRPSPLGDTYLHTTAFMHSKWHSFFTRPPAHWLWVTLMHCDNTCANAALHSRPQKTAWWNNGTTTAHKRVNAKWHKFSADELNSLQLPKTETSAEAEPGKQVGRPGDRLAHRYHIRGRHVEMKHYLWTCPFIFPLSCNAQRKVNILPPHTHKNKNPQWDYQAGMMHTAPIIQYLLVPSLIWVPRTAPLC